MIIIIIIIIYIDYNHESVSLQSFIATNMDIIYRYQNQSRKGEYKIASLF